MKTTYSLEDVQQFLETTEHAKPESIEQLSEGHIAQALTFETVDGNKQVLRISAKDEDFLADQYAYQHFRDSVPIPRILDIGKFGDGAFFCISNFVEGTTTNKFSPDEMEATLDGQNDTFACIFNADISYSSGYGHIDVKTGNAAHKSWKEFLINDIDEMDAEGLRKRAKNIGLEPALVDKFLAQYQKNLPFASETRRLLHGDLGFDNMLMKDNKVVAVIDWGQFAYGDWMHDYAKFDFWWPDRYTSPQTFADKYDLDAEHIAERIALYWAVTTLGTINFADKFKSERVTEWLLEHAAEKLT